MAKPLSFVFYIFLDGRWIFVYDLWGLYSLKIVSSCYTRRHYGSQSRYTTQQETRHSSSSARKTRYIENKKQNTILQEGVRQYRHLSDCGLRNS